MIWMCSTWPDGSEPSPVRPGSVLGGPILCILQVLESEGLAEVNLHPYDLDLFSVAQCSVFYRCWRVKDWPKCTPGTFICMTWICSTWPSSPPSRTVSTGTYGAPSTCCSVTLTNCSYPGNNPLSCPFCRPSLTK